MISTCPRGSLPALTAKEMASVDRAMFTVCGLDVLQVMEVAGRAVAVFARERYGLSDRQRGVVVLLAGPGGNGGDALVAARYLHSWGIPVEVWLSALPDPTRGVTAHQQQIAERIDVVTRQSGDAGFGHTGREVRLIVDGLFGFGLHGDPSGSAAGLIRWANADPADVVAIDIPSGLDSTSGVRYDPTIVAESTLTLGTLKTGLTNPDAWSACGQIFVADIGIPTLAFESTNNPRPGITWTGDFCEFVRD